MSLQLRGMNMLFESLKEKKPLVIVASSALQSMNLGAIGGQKALQKSEAEQLQIISSISCREYEPPLFHS